MNKKTFSITALLVLCAFVCFAIVADLTGKWTGKINTPDGTQFDLTYIFKVDGDKLSGSISTPQGELPISEGKISGADFSFKLDFNGTAIDNVGKYYGDSVTIDASIQGNKLHTKLLRAQ
jgi:hypothetical protein